MIVSRQADGPGVPDGGAGGASGGVSTVSAWGKLDFLADIDAVAILGQGAHIDGQAIMDRPDDGVDPGKDGEEADPADDLDGFGAGVMADARQSSRAGRQSG